MTQDESLSAEHPNSKLVPNEQWEERQKQYWDSMSSTFDTLYVHPYGLFEDAQIAQYLAEMTQFRPGKILDLACGTGLGYQTIRSVNPNLFYTGVDISPKMLERCRQKHPGIDVRLGSIDDLSDFASNSYEFIMGINTAFSYSQDPTYCLRQMNRILKPSGKFLMSAINRFATHRILRGAVSPVEKAFRSRKVSKESGSIPVLTYTTKQLRRMCADAGFTVEAIHAQGVLGNIFEQECFIPLEQALQKIVPFLGHTHNFVCRKD